MHRIIKIIAFAIFYILFQYPVIEIFAAGNPDVVMSTSIQLPPTKARESALNGKKHLERLAVTDRYARELGFDSKAQARDSNTSLGDAFLVIILNFTMLKSYDPNVDPKKLLVFLKRYIYPVIASEEVKSSVTVELKESTQSWKPVEWGSKGLIRLLVKTRATAGSANTSFLVWIPQLSRYFLGDVGKGRFSIIPLYDEKDYGFAAGVPKSAIEVFKIIAVEANKLPVPKT